MLLRRRKRLQQQLNAKSLQSTKRIAPPSTTEVVGPLTEFDEYGTELHKGARVWKVYVKETDKYDADLVRGWNESTDVILIFAALFSAILSAFLIESTKMLQPDPAEVSNQTLLVISQTLLAQENSARSPGVLAPSASNSVDFIPSRTAVWVNTLWYLSLGLSLATSFIAILAKDWCYSFMAGRTGDPYSQTCRRQRKWDMIERWKMSELLQVLPSLIHVALFSFCIGLSIQLWYTHTAVAIPVICISVIAIRFYIWSSVVAVIYDFFPYPTIISRLLRTEVAQLAVRWAWIMARRALLCLCMSVCILGVIMLVPPLCLLGFGLFLVGCLVGLLVVLLVMLLAIPGLLFVKFHYGCETSFPALSLILQLIKSLKFALVSISHSRMGVWGEKLYEQLDLSVPPVTDLVADVFGFPAEYSPSTIPQAITWSPVYAEASVTSLALSWLIKNCEVPDSVDVALQSIAGASTGFSSKPLDDCNATLEILKRLASSNIYRCGDSETSISLYSRALAFLSSSKNQGPDAAQDGTGGNLEVVIWNLQTEAEKNVAALITDGNFKPTQGNINALRIGNTAASNTLTLLKKDRRDTNAEVNKMLRSIGDALESYSKTNHSLHPAALLSLLHATLLLSLFAPRCTTAVVSALPLQCTRLACSFPPTHHIVSLAMTCAALYRTCIGKDRPEDPPWQDRVVQAFLGKPTQYTRASGMILLLEMLAVATHNQANQIQSIDLQRQEALDGLSAYGPIAYERIWITILGHPPTGETYPLYHGPTHFRDLHTVYDMAPVGIQHQFVHLLVVEAYCRIFQTWTDWAGCRQLLSKCPPLKLSHEVAWVLKERDLIYWLENSKALDHPPDKFFATGQLWLLFSLYVSSSSRTVDDRDALKIQLCRYNEDYLGREDIRHKQLGEEIEQLWGDHTRSIVEWLGEWAYRIMECVLQARNQPLPRETHDGLRDVPQEIRGLSSFIECEVRVAEATYGWDIGGAANAAAPDGHSTQNDERALIDGIVTNEGKLQGTGGEDHVQVDGDNAAAGEGAGAIGRQLSDRNQGEGNDKGNRESIGSHEPRSDGGGSVVGGLGAASEGNAMSVEVRRGGDETGGAVNEEPGTRTGSGGRDMAREEHVSIEISEPDSK